MEFSEFRKSTLKLNNKRHHKIKGSLGVRDAFNWCQKNKKFGKLKVDCSLFYKIIRTINRLMAEELIKGIDIRFPRRMGQLEVRKYSTYVRFIDGKIRTNRSINWDATIKLWYEDEEAKKNKTLIKNEDEEVFTIFYNRMIANFVNKTIYQFKPNRELQLAVKKAGKEGLIDAYQIGL